jgi:hypothetical protein
VRFHAAKPLAAHACEQGESLCVRAQFVYFRTGARVERFHVIEPLAACVCEAAAVVSLRAHDRVVRFHGVEPLDARLFKEAESLYDSRRNVAPIGMGVGDRLDFAGSGPWRPPGRGGVEGSVEGPSPPNTLVISLSFHTLRA